MSGNSATLPVLPPLVRTIARAVGRRGGRAWMVGGSVRDHLLGRPFKDVDLEVHGLDLDSLRAALVGVGPVAEVGRSFGVLKVGPGASAIDVVLPRPSADSTTSALHGLAAACDGRDLTINAIALDPLSGEIVDPTGGVRDLAACILRPVNPLRFGEDPLRVLRAARFLATFSFAPSTALLDTCRRVSLADVSPERMGAELERLWTYGATPERGLQFLVDVGAWPAVFPMVSRPVLAPVARAAALRDTVGPAPRAFILMAASTLSGVAPEVAAEQLRCLAIRRRDGTAIDGAVEQVLTALGALRSSASDTTLRTIAEFSDVAVAVATWAAVDDRDDVHVWLERAMALGVLHAPLAPLLVGRDVLEMGFPAGPLVGRVLAVVRAHQLRGEVASPGAAKDLVAALWASGAFDGPPSPRSPTMS